MASAAAPFDAADALALLCANVSPDLKTALPFEDDVLTSLLQLSRARQTICDCIGSLDKGTILQVALSAGAGDLVQQFYEDIADVESDVLADSNLTVYHVRAALGVWTFVLPDVAEFLQSVIARAISSGALLDLVHAKSQHGDHSVAAVYKEFLGRLHKPFFAQLMQWMAFARLDSRRSFAEDFFITGPTASADATPLYLAVTSNVLDGTVRAASDSDDRRAGWGCLSLRSDAAFEQAPSDSETGDLGQPAALSAHVPRHERDMSVGVGRSSEVGSWLSPTAAWGNRHNLSSASDALHDAVLERTWVTGYTLRQDRVPTSHFPLQLAETVLAVGKAMSLLQSLPGPVTGRITRMKGDGSEQERGKPAHDVVRKGRSAFFTREDSLAVQALISGLRSSPSYSQLAVQVVIDQVMGTVYSKLMATLVHACDLGLHTRALRAFALLGRGDFYGTFVEKSRQMVQAMSATSVSVLQAIHSGPWASAAQAVGLKSQEVSIWGDDGKEEEDHTATHDLDTYQAAAGSGSFHEHDAAVAALFPERVALRLAYKALRVESPVGVKVAKSEADNGRSWETDSVRTEASAPIGRPLSQSLYAQLYRAWSVNDFDHGQVGAYNKVPRGQASLLLAGSAQLCSLHCTKASTVAHEGGSRAPSRLAASAEASGASRSLLQNATLDRTRLLTSQTDPSESVPEFRDHYAGVLNRVMLAAAPDSRVAVGQEEARPGAAWLSQPIHASQGFVLRATVFIMLPKRISPELALQPAAVPGQAGSPTSVRPGATAAKDTVSFAVVMHRDLTMSLGVASPVDSAAHANAGMDGIPASIAVQFLVRRLAILDPSSDASHGGRGGEEAAAFRVVCAARGPPRSDRSAGDSAVRDLLAPAAAVDVPLTKECNVSSTSAHSGTVHGPLYEVYPLHLCLQYARDAAGSGGLSVTVLASAPSMPSPSASSHRVLSAARPGLVPGDARTDSLAAHTVLDFPLVLEDILPMGYSLAQATGAVAGGQYGPGRGRLYMGVTSAAAYTPEGSPCVFLETMDVVSASNADAGWSGLYPRYSVPWPLHTVLPSAVLSVITDVGRFALRVRTAHAGLNQVWRVLMDACTRGDGHGAASVAPGDAGSGVSAQLSGAGGKRSRDPTVLARAAARRELQDSLRAVFALRAKLAYVVDAINDHLQLDVVTSSHAEYSAALSQAKDFASVLRAGRAWASMLAQGAFLSQPSALDCIHRALDLSDRFTATVLKASAADLSVLTAGASLGADHGQGGVGGLSAPLQELSYAFSAEVRYLAQGVAGMAALRGGADTLSLIQRLDFNAFFSMEATSV